MEMKPKDGRLNRSRQSVWVGSLTSVTPLLDEINTSTQKMRNSGTEQAAKACAWLVFIWKAEISQALLEHGWVGFRSTTKSLFFLPCLFALLIPVCASSQPERCKKSSAWISVCVQSSVQQGK